MKEQGWFFTMAFNKQYKEQLELSFLSPVTQKYLDELKTPLYNTKEGAFYIWLTVFLLFLLVIGMATADSLLDAFSRAFWMIPGFLLTTVLYTFTREHRKMLAESLETLNRMYQAEMKGHCCDNFLATLDITMKDAVLENSKDKK